MNIGAIAVSKEYDKFKKQNEGEHEKKMIHPATLADLVKDFQRYNENPDVVDSFISEELLKLSIDDRNAILEEAHGVRCLAPDETPEKIQGALHQMEIELHNLPNAEKQAYLESQQHQQAYHRFPDGSIVAALEPSAVSTYVNAVDFRLRFLRATLFDVPKAAKRLARYLTLGVQLFGRDTLFRPVKLSDFSKEELSVYRTGYSQMLPFRDRNGRRIAIIFVNEQSEQVSFLFRIKLLFYMAHVFSNDDAQSQRKGVVVIYWSPNSMSYTIRHNNPAERSVDMRFFSPVRVSAIHFCTPDTLFHRFARGLWAINLGRDKLPMLRIHIGEPVELRYALESHGISTDQMPITWTGTIKRQNFKQWTRVRQLIEEGNNHHLPYMIETPRLNDVIFRQGTSAMSHPGNAIFRSRIQSLYEQAEAQSMARTTRTLVLNLIQELRIKRGRVLIWYQPPKGSTSNNSDAWWTELTDEDQVYKKVENLVREFKYSKAKYQFINRGADEENATTTPSGVTSSSFQNTSSSTSIFLQSSQQRSCCIHCNAGDRENEDGRCFCSRNL